MKSILRKLLGLRYECEECGYRFETPTKLELDITCTKINTCPKCKCTRIKSI